MKCRDLYEPSDLSGATGEPAFSSTLGKTEGAALTTSSCAWLDWKKGRGDGNAGGFRRGLKRGIKRQMVGSDQRGFKSPGARERLHSVPD